MIKKIISAVSALSMLAAFAVAPVNAAVEEDTVVYEYDYTQAGNTSDNMKAYGKVTTIGTNNGGASYGGLSNDYSVGNKQNVWTWASLNPNGGADSTLQPMSTVDFDGQTAGAALSTIGDNMVLLEMDMGMCLRYDEDGSLYLKFQGKDESDTLKTIAILKSSKSENATTATAQFLSADIAEDTVPAHSYVGNIFTYKATTSNSSNAHDRLKLTLLFDMKSQSYSAYLSKIADAGATEEIETPTVTAMVENQPFIDNDIKYPSTLRTMAYKGYSQTYITPVSVNMTILSDDNALNYAYENLSIPSAATDNLALPSNYLGTNITWQSSNPNVISNDGKVTPVSTETTVTMTATLSRGTANAKKEFTVTVPAVYVPVPVPEDGVWVDDNMDYASVDEIPAIADNAYGFEFEQDSGTVSTGDGTITLIRETNTGNLGMYKYLAPSVEQQHNSKQIVEYKITQIGKPVVYTAVQSYNDWKGIQTLQITKYQDFSPYTGSGSIDAPESMTVTMITDAASQIMDVYVNGKLQWDDIAYRSDWSGSAGFDYFGRIYMSVSNDSPVGSGIKVDYIRTFEDIESYGEYCLEKAGAGVDIPSEIAAGVDEISLPTADNYNNAIAWSSDNAAISTDGTVTHGIADVTVQLTPTYTNNVTGSSKDGDPITVTVKAKKKTTTVGDPLEAINPDIAGDETQYAVGFMNTFTSQNTGYAPEFGFILSYQDKTDMTVMISDNVEASEVKAGVILTYDEEDGFVLNNLTVRPYITE